MDISTLALPGEFETVKSLLDQLETAQGHSDQVFVEQAVLAHACRGKQLYTEIGLNLGHSALVALCADPDIQVVSFELGEHPSTRQACEILQSAFGQKRLRVVWGDSTKTVPKEPALGADVIFIDGGHSYQIAMDDLRNMKRHAKASDHLLIMDDVYCEADWCDGPGRAWHWMRWTKAVTETSHTSSNPVDGIMTRGFATGKYL
jgi:predicted O-methyltransferase YrrM